MSDFLGNLALKSLGLAPVVQPRPLTPFEPVPAGGALTRLTEAPAPAEPTTESVSAEREARAAHRPRPLAQALFAEPSAVDSPPAPRVQSAATPQPRAPARAEDSSPLPAVPVPVRGASAETVAARPTLPSYSEAERAPEARPISLLRPPPALPLPFETDARPRSDARAPDHHAAPLAPANPLAVTDSHSQPATPAPRTVLTPIVERIMPSPRQDKAPLAKAPVNAPTANAAAPTISVTIGRVEVRAAPAATAPARRTPSKPGPALSLEDYLRLRSGGKP